MSCCNSNCNHDPCGSSFNQSLTRAAQYAQYAQTQANKAEDLWLEFNALYLGAFASAPTVDNEGNPLKVGALYWNTVSNDLWVWNGTLWIDAGFNEFTPFLATGTTTPRNLATRFADVVNVKDFGAVGDGVTDDTVAIQAALNYATSNLLSIKPVFVPAGEYKVGRIILPYGTIMSGAGGTVEALNTAGTRFLQNTNDDIFVFDPAFGGTFYYWAGKISNISIQGNNIYTNGYAFNAKNVSGNRVFFVDQTSFENMTIRNMPKGGFFIASAYPLTIKNIKLLWNGGPGITCTKFDGLGLYQGVHFSDISGDGNINGLLNFSNLSRNDGILISNLKSEARVNNVYGGGIGQQENAIVITNSASSVIAINGANHISSIPDGLGNQKKPGDFIRITDVYLPKITWNGVIVGFPLASTGPDPLIVKSAFTFVYQPNYSISSGTFNVEFPFHASKMLFHRNGVSGGTPSVNRCNALTISNASPTTITNITDGDDGQFIILSFQDSNTTVQNNSNIALNDGGDWTPGGNSILSLIYIGGKWREVSRSYGVSTGTFIITNVTTDRAYDADSTTIDELADVLGTLIEDLQTRGVI